MRKKLTFLFFLFFTFSVYSQQGKETVERINCVEKFAGADLCYRGYGLFGGVIEYYIFDVYGEEQLNSRVVCDSDSPAGQKECYFGIKYKNPKQGSYKIKMMFKGKEILVQEFSV
ncbi:MAG: hypothetical protein KBD63_07245 [Bacteriovoracaceae bacterium]|nr:hypothetical protein [Bacteriovoracaceae bacterium]